MVKKTETKPYINIREAKADDETWVTNLMVRVLTAYYDGDHQARARRIIRTHLAGGRDHIGFFSHEQRMFVGEIDGQLAGVIHVVGKRQQTYKISPLIVSEEFRGVCGLGYALYAHVENYVRKRSARQLYCTVAEENRAATNFFLRQGFVCAGSSYSHYKKDSRELMFYKILSENEALIKKDIPAISVLPLEDKDMGQVRQLILSTLPKTFSGIDDVWIKSLFAGYGRRDSGDVNSKYKLIFVASDFEGKVIGVAAAIPKKGTLIKLMPLIASNDLAFNALLSDLPFQLSGYGGRKLYLHITPTTSEVVCLQHHGWKIDAILPAAYRSDVVTQQWSLDINQDTLRTIRVKKRFFDFIKSGEKTLEVRVGYDTIRGIKKGENIRFLTYEESLIVKVIDKREYPSFKETLKNEPFGKIVPDADSATTAFGILKSFYGDQKEALGVIVIEFRTFP
ncbi:GNAT family N-acetyltransferase [Candidatus Uhrbacteria bacterium]|nr:GNAT family N-acetyltransferase [Candidatus Uhrbacteria bacterium]